MPAGRPTKYNKAAQEAADAYVAGGYEVAGDAVPSVAGLACELGVTRTTLRNWGEENGQFLTTLDRCAQVQERVAVNGGLKGEFNAAITKLILANHGYSEKQQLEHSGPGGGPIQTESTWREKLRGEVEE